MKKGFFISHSQKMTNIKFDAHNYRTHDEKNLKLIKKSLKELGAGRSIVIDSEGEIIDGKAGPLIGGLKCPAEIKI